MMETCEKTREKIAALVDRELPSGEMEHVEEHVGQCRPCLKELLESLAAGAALAKLFERTVAESPPFPADRLMRQPKRSVGRSVRRIPPWMAVAAALVITISILWIIRPETEVHGAKKLRAAIRNLHALADIELRVTMDSPAAGLFARIISDKAKSNGGPTVLRVVAKSPNRLFVGPFDGSASEDRYGFDGATLWRWIPSEQRVEATPPEELDRFRDRPIEPSDPDLRYYLGGMDRAAFEHLDLLRYLSWDTILELTKNESWIEVTTSLHREADRRVFRVVLGSDEEPGEVAPPLGDTPEDDWMLYELTLTLDPDRDLVERLDLKVSLLDIPILEIAAEAMARNVGVSDSIFDYRTHIPEGTRVESPGFGVKR